jgi:hypothetical protein
MWWKQSMLGKSRKGGQAEKGRAKSRKEGGES